MGLPARLLMVAPDQSPIQAVVAPNHLPTFPPPPTQPRIPGPGITAPRINFLTIMDPHRVSVKGRMQNSSPCRSKNCMAVRMFFFISFLIFRSFFPVPFSQAVKVYCPTFHLMFCISSFLPLRTRTVTAEMPISSACFFNQFFLKGCQSYELC